MSRDEINYTHLIKILNYYRLTLGQPRQEELLEYVFSEVKDTEELKQLFIDLSPFSKNGKKDIDSLSQTGKNQELSESET